MEESVNEESKFFDDTVALINGSVSSTLPPGLSKESCEIDSTWFVKTEPTSPVGNSTDEEQNPGLQLGCEPNIFIKTDFTSPVWKHVGLPIELYEIDSKAWFVNTEPTSPVRDPTEVDQNQDAANKQMTESDQSEQSSYCPTAAQLQSDQQIHIQSVHKKMRVIQCPFCKYYTSLEENLKIHLAIHTKIKAFQCVFCKYLANSKIYLKRHVDGVHKKITLQCPHCDYTTKWKNSLKRHIDLTHNKIWALQCPHCVYKSKSKSILKAHIDAIHKKITLECSHCDYTTKWMSTLKRHIDSAHKKVWAFHCAHCEYKANWKVNLSRHIKVVHKQGTVL